MFKKKRKNVSSFCGEGEDEEEEEGMVVVMVEEKCFLIRVTVVLLSPAPRQTKWHFLTVPIPV